MSYPACRILAVAADFLLRCGLRRGSGYSMLPISMDFKRSIRRAMFEFTQSRDNPVLCRRGYCPCRKTLHVPRFCSADHRCSQVMKASTLSVRIAVRGIAKKYPYDVSSASERRTNLNFVPVPGHWGTLAQSEKPTPNGTTATEVHRRL